MGRRREVEPGSQGAKVNKYKSEFPEPVRRRSSAENKQIDVASLLDDMSKSSLNPDIRAFQELRNKYQGRRRNRR